MDKIRIRYQGQLSFYDYRTSKNRVFDSVYAPIKNDVKEVAGYDPSSCQVNNDFIIRRPFLCNDPHNHLNLELFVRHSLHIDLDILVAMSLYQSVRPFARQSNQE